MKRLLLLLSLCVAVPSYAGSLITATITVTNTPADGDTITVNGSARTWKTTVVTPSTQVTIGASIGANATNLFSQFSGNPFTTLTLNRSGTNGVTLRGIVDQAMTLSIAGTWGSYSLATNTTTEGDSVRVPAASYQSQSKATNIISQLASDLGTYSTNALATGTTLVGNLVQTSGNQSITGAKSWDGANSLTNTLSLAFVGILSDAPTNGIYFGTTTGTNTFYNIHGNGLGEPTIVDSGGNPPTSLPDSLGGIITYGVLTAYFPVMSGTLTNSWERANQFSKITANSGTLTNLTYSAGTASGVSVTNGVNYANGSIMQTVSSLATGSNAGVPTEGYDFIKLTAGPGGAFSLDGMAGGGIRSLWLYNATGQNMTVKNESGTDPVATNRIVTMTGADVATTANGSAYFKYDTTAQRWICLLVSP